MPGSKTSSAAEPLRVSEIARRDGVTPRYVSRLLEMAFLPPKLVEAILAGAQPAGMTARSERRGMWRGEFEAPWAWRRL